MGGADAVDGADGMYGWMSSLPTDIIAFFGLVVVVWGAIALRTKLSEVHHQVVNDHGVNATNLRDDIDGIAKTLQAIWGRVGSIDALIIQTLTEVSGVRTELHDERQRSIGTDEALHRMLINYVTTGHIQSVRLPAPSPPTVGDRPTTPPPMPD